MDRYEEALERAKRGMPMDEVFPELKESEDERIWKAISYAICTATHRDGTLINYVTKDEALAYLEKQKEQPTSAIDVLARAGLKPYKDGNQWCILAGDNIQEGICGFGDTIDEALYEFLKEVLIMANSPQLKEQPAEWSITDATFIEEIDETLFMAETGRNEVVKNQIERERNWLKSLPERLNLHPKQEWSEKDEAMLKEIISFFKDGSVKLQHDVDLYACFLEKRLKSLPERFNLQPKHEWTDDDEQHLKWLCRIIHSRKNHGELSLTEESELGNWIDKWINHNPQPHWKPSEEQMDALADATMRDVFPKGNREHLESLCDDLKKLM